MPLGKTADKLLYAPFVGVYEVPENIRKALTADEFFKDGGCYVAPDFEKQIELLSRPSYNSMDGDDRPLSVTEVIESLKKGRDDLDALNNWLETGGDGVFTILGDAGTGKSTFLHHLEWSQKDIQWRIIDLKKALAEIEAGGSGISFSRAEFASLNGKVLSAVIMEIRDLLFAKEENGNYNHVRNRETIQLLLQRYDDRIADATPQKKYAELYRQLKAVEFHKGTDREDREYCENCAGVFTEYFNRNCAGLERNRDTEAEALKCVLTQFLIVLRCFEDKNGGKTVIAFDNIERFIGADEIYNKELTDFLSDMRGFCDLNRDRYKNDKINLNRFAAKYQFIVSMRNTTVRNHTPAESTDFKRHTLDLSNWFAIDEIIRSKLTWYDNRQIIVMDDWTKAHLYNILNDFGVTTDQSLFGVRPKLDMLFNYNKRLIISFLLKVLEERNPPDRMEAIDSFYAIKDTKRENADRARFGYRSVIWRCALDRLRNGALFQNIFHEHTTLPGIIADINYVWKILVVLHNFSVNSGGSETAVSGTEKYMSLLDLIQAVYNEHGNFTPRFYENSFSKERKRMARLLHFMNSYDRDKNNWFQFVDIQYNVDNANRKFIGKWTDLLEIFMDAQGDPRMLRIRITTAGKAYLNYVAPSFEFVACMAGKLPLLCCLPTEEELKTYSLTDQKCIQVIYDTMDEMELFIADFKSSANNPNLLYQRTADARGQSYVEGLIKSTYGYLVNFADCVMRLVKVTSKTTDKLKRELAGEITNEAEMLRSRHSLPKNIK